MILLLVPKYNYVINKCDHADLQTLTMSAHKIATFFQLCVAIT